MRPLLPSGPVRRVAEDPEDLLGGGGRLLHVCADRHLHVPVQDRLRDAAGHPGHVRGRVSDRVRHQQMGLKNNNRESDTNKFKGERVRHEHV